MGEQALQVYLRSHRGNEESGKEDGDREHEAQAFPRDRPAIASMERSELLAGEDCDCDGHAIGVSSASNQAKEPGHRDPARA
ncbi:MAG: hypothetical protein NVSMB10_12370 [Steroidobacteraceae bacterium]